MVIAVIAELAENEGRGNIHPSYDIGYQNKILTVYKRKDVELEGRQGMGIDME